MVRSSAVRAPALGLALLALASCRSEDRAPAVSQANLAEFGVDASNVVAPPLDITALDGARLKVEQFRGQVLFVNFWATWCPPCRAEMPSMLALGRDLEARYPGKFRMLAVSVDDGWNPVKEFFAAPPYQGNTQGLTVALDEEQKVTSAYYCSARGGCPDSFKFPESYIVDKNGRLVAYVVGPRNWDHPTARAYLESLIKS
jgi:thiol-disulfide isomerase/thioredoxin